MWAAEGCSVALEDSLDGIQLDYNDRVRFGVVVGVSVDNGVIEDLDGDGVVEGLRERDPG